MAETDEYVIDLDAFAPAAGKRIRFQGKFYAIRNFNDIPADDVFTILRAEQELKGKGPAEQIELGLHYLQILAPEMGRDVLGRLTSNQILRVMREAMGVAEVPPPGGNGASALVTSSPSSPVSTDGPMGTSAA